MVTHAPLDLRLRAAPSSALPDDGIWQPRSRVLADELLHLVAGWPDDAGRIVRVLYCRLDWDDRPRAVTVGDRVVKTGSFPHDCSHQMTLVMSDRRRLLLSVVAPPAADPAADDCRADGVAV